VDIIGFVNTSQAFTLSDINWRVRSQFVVPVALPLYELLSAKLNRP